MNNIITNRLLLCLLAAAVLAAWPLGAGATTYTLDGDFDGGTLINVNHDTPNNDQLQLNPPQEPEPFPFINVAASARGTIVRIDTDTGDVIGEYRSAPQGMGLNPSRTTVDLFGNVWCGNRDESSGGMGSVVKVGLVVGGTRVNADGTPNPSGQYLLPPFDYSTVTDRDGDGLIKTSLCLGDILPWSNAGGADTNGGVSTADDEAIVIYQRVNGSCIRHVSVDANNDVWVGGHFCGDNTFDLLDGDTGAILATFNVGVGGYGGLVDGNGILWASSRAPMGLLRYDTNGTITTLDDTWQNLNTGNAYGLGIDSGGNIWHSQYTNNTITKYAPDGTLLFTVPTGGANYDRGVAVTLADDNVWVANSGGSDVSRLDNNGNVLKVIPVGSAPTGVSVDSNGKVWVTNLNSHDTMRIDPAGGVDGLGAVDLTVSLGAGAGPYNYSDMTGSVILGATSSQGTWTLVHDTEQLAAEGYVISWTSDEPAGTAVTVEARADDVAGAGSWVPVTNGVDPGLVGQYIEVRVELSRDPDLEDTPVLFDLTIEPGVIDVSVDIKPMSCPNPINFKSRGVLPVAILGTDEFDPTMVDVATITLAGVSPIRSNYEDVTTPLENPDECECNREGGDGLLDLTLKFRVQDIVAAIHGVSDGEFVPLELTGLLQEEFGATPIIGGDCVRIIKKRNSEWLNVLNSRQSMRW